MEIFETFKRLDYHEKMSKDLPLPEREYLSIYLRADSEKKLYKRVGYDILSYLGDLGGLLDVVMVVGQICTSVFVGRLFQAALIQSAYRIQSYDRDFEQFYQTKEDCILTSQESEADD